MKKLFFIFASFVLFHFVGAAEISGTITLAKGVDKKIEAKGSLFIFAKKAGEASANGAPPIAVLRVTDPKFPYHFSLSEKNTMIQGTSFEGPFVVYARYSPSGDALDKSGPQGSSDPQKQIKAGEKNIKIQLK